MTAPSTPARRSTRLNSDDVFTAYDLWIAGVSSQSFGVIPDNQTFDEYRRLLDRTRNIFSGYGAMAKDRGKLAETERSRIASRRTMHAAASSEDSHYQNYIGNLSAEPSAREYVAREYI